MRFHTLSCTASLLTLLSFSAQAGEPAASEFPFQYREGLIWVKVRVQESSKPLNMLLDSGANVSVINLPTARKLGLKLGEAVSVDGVNATTGGYWPEHLSAASDTPSLPKEFLAVDLSDLSRGSECVVDGLLGADFFAGRVVRIDFAAHKVQLLPAARATGTQETLPLRKNQESLQVPVRVNGSDAQWVRLDTGCSAALHWVAGKVHFGETTPQMSIALTKTSIPFAKTSVQLGKVSFESTPTGIYQHEIFPGESGLLGNGLLSRFSAVTIDVPSGRVVLEENSAPVVVTSSTGFRR